MTNILDYMFNGTTGIIASLQLNFKVGDMADPVTSNMYEERGCDLPYYNLGPKNMLNFCKNYPSIVGLKETKIYILELGYISPS